MTLQRYKQLYESFSKKENDTFIYIQNAKLNCNSVKLSDDFTAKTAINRSKILIKKKMNPKELDPIKIKIDTNGEAQIVDGNARLLLYKYNKQSIDRFFIYKKESSSDGIKIFLNNLK